MAKDLGGSGRGTPNSQSSQKKKKKKEKRVVRYQASVAVLRPAQGPERKNRKPELAR